MISCAYIQAAERNLAHGAHTRHITYKYLYPYLRQDPGTLFAPPLGFATSENVVESVVSALCVVGKIRLFPRALHQSQIQSRSYFLPSVGMLLDRGLTQGSLCALQELCPVPGAGSWGTTRGLPGQTHAAEVFNVSYAVQAPGLEQHLGVT